MLHIQGNAATFWTSPHTLNTTWSYTKLKGTLWQRWWEILYVNVIQTTHISWQYWWRTQAVWPSARRTCPHSSAPLAMTLTLLHTALSWGTRRPIHYQEPQQSSLPLSLSLALSLKHTHTHTHTLAFFLSMQQAHQEWYRSHCSHMPTQPRYMQIAFLSTSSTSNQMSTALNLFESWKKIDSGKTGSQQEIAIASKKEGYVYKQN